MADEPEWDPKTGKVVGRSSSAPAGSPRQRVPVREIDLDVDSMLPGGGIMKGRSRTYSKGGIVGPNTLKWGSPKVSAPCKDTKTIKCS